MTGPMMNGDFDMADVTQEDRELAIELGAIDRNFTGVRAGGYDDLPPLQGIAAHREAAFKAGEDAERARVVAWLRSHGLTGTVTRIDMYLANALERDEHRENRDDQS